MGIGSVLRGVGRVARRFVKKRGLLSLAKSKGDAADVGRIDPVFKQRTFDEDAIPPGEPPEAGFRVNEAVTAEQSILPTRFIREAVGLVEDTGPASREVTSVRANADVWREMGENPRGENSVMHVEYRDVGDDGAGHFEFYDEPRAQSYESVMDLRGLDTGNPSMRTFDDALDDLYENR